MVILQNARTAVAANTVIRLLSGVAVFVLAARFLGPAQFSVFATAMALGSVASLISDYGLPIQTLRAAAIEPTRLRPILHNALLFKLIFSGAIWMILAVAVTILDPSPQALLCGCIIVLGVFLAGFADLCFVAPRATEQFSRETAPVLWTSIFSLVGIGGVAAITGDLLMTSLAFLVSRAVYLLSAFVLMSSLVAGQKSEPVWQGVRPLVRNARGYAADGILTSLSSQIDILLAPLVLSVAEAGVYQAGARVIQVIAPLAMILGTVYIPKLARLRQAQDTAGFMAACDRASMEFFVFGVLIFCGIVFAVSPMTVMIFGADYASLTQVWPIFACFALIRFGSAGYGVRLVATGDMLGRVMSQVFSISVVLLLFLTIAPGREASFIAWIPVVGAIVLAVIYALSVIRYEFRIKDHIFLLINLGIFICVLSVQ